eukprot:TRINITY_DN7654_c0_g1_i1.p1 TRINITY_DN7654_c0_g1~~TRINITY_DN7654_c0_g1_i1.p1  ORF type:complete len:321 (-),score=67.87 TRINITY_DN7654_c0_g1_i1:26-955(-)
MGAGLGAGGGARHLATVLDPLGVGSSGARHLATVLDPLGVGSSGLEGGAVSSRGPRLAVLPSSSAFTETEQVQQSPGWARFKSNVQPPNLPDASQQNSEPAGLPQPDATEGPVQVADLNPEEAKALEPKDKTSEDVKQLDKLSLQDLAKTRKSIADERRAMFEAGRGQELPAEDRPETYGQEAHQLMQSGDYGNGPPYPIEGAEPPVWRGQGLEGTDNITEIRSTKNLGRGESHEIIRCFDQGGTEQPCGKIYNMDVLDDSANSLFGAGGGPLNSGAAAPALQSVLALLGARRHRRCPAGLAAKRSSFL